MVDLIDDLPKLGTRVGAVLFSDRGELLFNFEQFSKDRTAARNTLIDTQYPGANTNTSGGLYVARTLLFAANQRPDALKIAVVITDGKSTYDSDRTIIIAEDLRQDMVDVISIGITDSIDVNELKAISSLPQRLGQNYYTSTDFRQLENIKNSLLASFCPSSTETTTDFMTTDLPSSTLTSKFNPSLVLM